MQEEPQPDPVWQNVPDQIHKWYDILAAESFRLWPYQTIPYKGLELHGDRIGGAIIERESSGDPSVPSHVPAVVYNGVEYHAWGLMQVIPRIPGHPWFSNRPTVEELMVPAINVKWGMGIFHGSLVRSDGDLWEALKRYCGMASHTMAEFWERYGTKFRNDYAAWWDIGIPQPEQECIELQRKLDSARAYMTTSRNTLNQGLTDSE